MRRNGKDPTLSCSTLTLQSRWKGSNHGFTPLVWRQHHQKRRNEAYHQRKHKRLCGKYNRLRTWNIFIISLTGSIYSSNAWTKNSIVQLALHITHFSNILSYWVCTHVPVSAHEGTPIYAVPLTVNKTDVWQLANSSYASISPPSQSSSISVYPTERENLENISCAHSVNRSKENVAQGLYVGSRNLPG